MFVLTENVSDKICILVYRHVKQFNVTHRPIKGRKTNHYINRDVTKFEFEFDDVRTSNIFTRFEIRRIFYFVVECEFVEKSLFYG